MSERRGYVSDRNLPLFPAGGSTPYVTGENYMKWYSSYLVWPETGFVARIEWGRMAEAVWRDEWGCAEGDHCVNPELIRRFASRHGFGIAAGYWAEVVSRWHGEDD